MEKQIIGIIGGSGLYQMEGLLNPKEIRLETPFGNPSDAYIVGEFEDKELVFLPRHGRGHRYSPSEVNYRANIYGLKKLGVNWIISISAVGSLREDIHPGDVVVVDQFFDHTKHRASSFFSDGIVGHISFADPVCSALAEILYTAAKKIGICAHPKGTYICIEGPQFSTRGESYIYRKWGLDIIGMTNMPEAKLAREAGICYSTLALVTDYDCWHQFEEAVSVEAVVKQLQKNVVSAKEIIRESVRNIIKERRCECKNANTNAVITDMEIVHQTAQPVRERLNLILRKD